MNNKGWGLKEMLVLCIVLIGALIIAAIIIITNFFSLINQKNINGSKIDETRTYNSMELQMITASQKYIKRYYNNLKEDDPLYIKVSTLQNEKILSELYDIKDAGIECSGYVKVIQKHSEIRYEPYMKCGSNYTTEGYIGRYDG